MNENQYGWQAITADQADELDDLAEEIIRLQERVRALERYNESPDKGFYVRVIFDAFLFAVAIITIIGWIV